MSCGRRGSVVRKRRRQAEKQEKQTPSLVLFSVREEVMGGEKKSGIFLLRRGERLNALVFVFRGRFLRHATLQIFKDQGASGRLRPEKDGGVRDAVQNFRSHKR